MQPFRGGRYFLIHWVIIVTTSSWNIPFNKVIHRIELRARVPGNHCKVNRDVIRRLVVIISEMHVRNHVFVSLKQSPIACNACHAHFRSYPQCALSLGWEHISPEGRPTQWPLHQSNDAPDSRQTPVSLNEQLQLSRHYYWHALWWPFAIHRHQSWSLAVLLSGYLHRFFCFATSVFSIGFKYSSLTSMSNADDSVWRSIGPPVALPPLFDDVPLYDLPDLTSAYRKFDTPPQDIPYLL